MTDPRPIPTPEAVTETLRGILAGPMACSRMDRFAPEARLGHDLGLDSVQLMTLMLHLEEAGIEMAEDTFDRAPGLTIRALARGPVRRHPRRGGADRHQGPLRRQLLLPGAEGSRRDRPPPALCRVVGRAGRDRRPDAPVLSRRRYRPRLLLSLDEAAVRGDGRTLGMTMPRPSRRTCNGWSG